MRQRFRYVQNLDRPRTPHDVVGCDTSLERYLRTSEFIHRLTSKASIRMNRLIDDNVSDLRTRR